MKEAHKELLDYILPELNKNSTAWHSLRKLVHEFSKKHDFEMDYAEQRHFLELYNYEYFTCAEKSVDHIRISTQAKEIIDDFETLSAYLQVKDEKFTKEEELAMELHDLQVENFTLQNENLKLQNRNLKRQVFYALIGFGAGIISGNIKTIALFVLGLFS